ncbi:MAG: UbiX family flavin prenyltransferase [Candidatus Sumerlaeaceae bacterium]|nr:UbiX family flavin prenyltransferase [Candidatus Sumerlaeaceae bacterium]
MTGRPGDKYHRDPTSQFVFLTLIAGCHAPAPTPPVNTNRHADLNGTVNAHRLDGIPLFILMATQPAKRIIMGVSGASGAIYGRMLLDELEKLGTEIHLIVSPTSHIVMREELGITFPADRFDPSKFLGRKVKPGQIVLHNDADLAAGPASGSFRSAGMVVCPCSMKTLGSLASGTGSSLVTRAADACLKERRRLVLVPRETPLNLIHLRNMTTLTEAGAVILPAMPGFYHRPTTIEELARHLVLKILDSLGVEHHIGYRWKDEG